MLGFTPGKTALYRSALTHRSVRDSADENNERLEYLGDAILSGIIADFLFKKYPYKEEGFLTEMRSKMVNRNKLNEIAIKMGLKKITFYNKFDNSLKMSQIFGNTLEAVVGAVYLDKGFKKTQLWVMERIIIPHLFMEDLENLEINHKNRLYGWPNKVEREDYSSRPFSAILFNPNFSRAIAAAIWLASFLLYALASAISSPSTTAPMVNRRLPASILSSRVSNSRFFPFLFAHPYNRFL